MFVWRCLGNPAPSSPRVIINTGKHEGSSRDAFPVSNLAAEKVIFVLRCSLFPEPHIIFVSWIWKAAFSALQSGTYTLSYPRGRYFLLRKHNYYMICQSMPWLYHRAMIPPVEMEQPCWFKCSFESVGLFHFNREYHVPVDCISSGLYISTISYIGLFVSAGACNLEVPGSNPGRAGYLSWWSCIDSAQYCLKAWREQCCLW